MYLLVTVITITIVLLLNRLFQQRNRAGVKGWVVSQDLDGKSGRIYRDEKTGISCKPDVVEHGRIIEYKSASVQGHARQGDVLQVAAQMLATKANAAELRYGNDQRFAFDKESRQMQAAMKSVREIIRRMRWYLCSKSVPRGKPSPKKCGCCIFRQECPQAIS